MKQKRTKYIKAYLTDKELFSIKKHIKDNDYSSDAEFARVALKEKVKRDKKKTDSV